MAPAPRTTLRAWRCCMAGTGLEGRQVTRDLPGPDLGVVLAPLVALQAEELVGDRPEAAADDGVGLEAVERRVQGLRQDLEAAPGDLGRTRLVEVPLVGLAGVALVA